MNIIPAEFVESFRESMPSSYRQKQSVDEILAHAQIAWRRGDELVHAEIWTKRGNAVIVCIVTDDRPGLPALIRATVAAFDLHVSAEQVYSRTNEKGHVEAVHFLWLAPAQDATDTTAISAEDVANISASLSALLRGETNLGAVIDRVSSAPPSRPPILVDVGFAEDVDADGAVLLSVDAIDRPGLLDAIRSVLDTKKVSVIHSDFTTSGSRALCRFQVVEADRGPMSQARAREVADALLDALEKA